MRGCIRRKATATSTRALVLLNAKMSGHQPNFFVGDFLRQGFLNRLQPLFAKLLNCGSNLRVTLGAEPLGLEP